MPDGNLRDEFNSRLEAAEARTAASFARVEAAIERVAEGQSALGRRVDDLAEQVRSVRSDNRFTRYTIVATGITSLLAIMALAVALVQIDAAHQQNLLAMFQTAMARR